MSEQQIREVCMSFLNKASSGDSQAGPTVPDDPRFSKAYPALWEYCTADQYPDGSKRVRSSMVLFCEDSVVKLCLNDKDQARAIWVTADTVEKAFGAADKALQTANPPWRRDTRPQGQNGQQKRR